MTQLFPYFIGVVVGFLLRPIVFGMYEALYLEFEERVINRLNKELNTNKSAK